MLTAITKIRNLGVFGDYAKPQNLKDFSRYNLIYGENGAGKTTLSRLFSALNDGVHPEYPMLEFGVDAEGGAIGKGQKSARKIRIFNSDFVETNIGKFDGPLRPILIVGVENKTLAEEVRREQSIYDARSTRIGEVTTSIGRAVTEKGKIFSAVAKTIGEATSGASLRSYRKPDAEKDFVRLQPLKAYSHEELEVSRATLRQEQADPVSGFALPSQVRDGQIGPVPFADALGQFSALVIALTPKTAQEGAVRRLVENPDISKWVEEGIKLHRDHSSEVCEYCVQPIPPGRIEALAQHFGAADQLLKAEIEAAIARGRTLVESLGAFQPPAQQTLYSELWKDYEAATAMFEEARTACLERLSALDAILVDKLIRRSTAFEADAFIETEVLGDAANQLDGILQRHNTKTAQFASAKPRRFCEDRYAFSLGLPELSKRMVEQNYFCWDSIDRNRAMNYAVIDIAPGRVRELTDGEHQVVFFYLYPCRQPEADVNLMITSCYAREVIFRQVKRRYNMHALLRTCLYKEQRIP